MIAFAYYGAKNGLLSTLLPLLPECDHYCEPYAGSATVLLNRAPSKIETLNDLNGDIVNFFKVLREDGSKLVTALALTPYSYSEFCAAWNDDTEDPVERARRLYIRTQMDVAKAGHRKDKSWSVNKKYVPGGHSYCVKNFHSKIYGLDDVVARLKNVQIDCRPAVECIKKFDSKGTLIYADPPYLPETRKSANDYKFEMSVQQHLDLAQTLNDCIGRVALSGYDNQIMESSYKGWHKHLFKSRRVPMSRGSGLVRQECLWTNYDPYKFGRQSNIFEEAIAI